ncbi:centromere protein J [Chironomus tepperi]|uniref:centromere protein J n=1 Tax=Chironomus tepperi TaxID=113505 RepID=UPI00391FBBB1
METRQKELQDKLNELKQYEEEQKNLMIMTQKSLLTKEQLQMYEILGISLSSFMEMQNNDNLEEINDNNSDDDSHIINDYEDPVDDSDIEEQNSPTNYNNELINKNDIISVQQKFDVEEFKETGSELQVPKKPFLKRGAGLSSRFNMDPDRFSLKKLPPYKYSDRIKKTLAKTKNPQLRDAEPAKKERPKSLDNNRTDKPKSFDNDSKKTARKSDPGTKKNEVKVVPEVPESKDLVVPQTNLKIPPAKPIEPPSNPVLERILSKPSPQEIKETPKNPKLPKGVSWAQILSSNNIADCSVNLNQLVAPTENEHDETSLFQLLEERINNLNLDSSPSSLIKLLSSLQSDQSSNSEAIKEFLKPDDPIINEDANTINLKIQPHPSDVNKKIIIDEDESSEEEEETVMPDDDDDDEEDEIDHRVRFAENVEFVNDDTNSSILSRDLDAVELSQTSTPNEKLKFQEFKRKMLGTSINNSHLEQQAAELKEKTELLRMKLQEIEKEKSNIIKIRSELELDKLQLENERDDLFERLKDEKIRMEMEIHDEKMKIEQQKQKLDKMLRDAKNPTKKEREEVTKLKETIEELKEEMKSKEVRHGSSQARYRSQIKVLEKENQTLKLELEAARKDNKKLELENARLKRETNTKMLQEINKNIAKLSQPEAVPTKKPETKKTEVRRKSEPAPKPVPKKMAQILKEILTSSESSGDEDDENLGIDTNQIRSRSSDPIRKTSTIQNRVSTSSSDILQEMKREIVNSDGSKDIWYPNGNLKKISPDGLMIRMLYYNKDIKETNMNEGTVKYYYADTNTWHTTYVDGLEILEYPSGEIEHRYKDGTIEIHYTDGSIRITNKNWTNDIKEEWRMPDGTNAKIYKNDTKVLSFPNGQREIHTSNYKRREFPDGTVKIVYEDGSMETRYSNGRIRMKDKDGNLVSDTISN